MTCAHGVKYLIDFEGFHPVPRALPTEPPGCFTWDIEYRRYRLSFVLKSEVMFDGNTRAYADAPIRDALSISPTTFPIAQ